jgi:hypothetical protein
MAMKTANEDVYSRIKSASSLIASGVRLRKPEMERQGREAFADAHVENAILVHSTFLTDEARKKLAKLLFATTDADTNDTFNAIAESDAEEEFEEVEEVEEEEEFEDNEE